jgi:alpha-L-rhamnosidase
VTIRPELIVEHGLAFGVATARPRLSWRIPGAPDGWTQAAYELAQHTADAPRRVVRVESADSVLVPWPFDPLSSRERTQVSVRAIDLAGRAVQWSHPVTIEAALLDAGDWLAAAVSPDRDEDLTGGQAPALLRHEFAVQETPVAARLFITAHGIYTASINGERVSDDLLTPGWSAYRSRLRYQMHDVTAHLRLGANALGITLADGWYCGYLAWADRRNWYGSRVAALAQLELTYAGGRREVIGTDQRWRSASGPLRTADLYMGERYDARLEPSVTGWDRPGFDDSSWTHCVVVDRDPGTLVRQTSPPVRRTQTVAPVALLAAPSGAIIADFGQNLVGRVRLTELTAPAGTEVVLRHAEVLQDGELCTAPLRSALQTDTYIAAGGGEESWEPEFTFHGFRYAEVTGWPGPLTTTNMEAHVCHSDMRRTGWFSCSDDLVNRLHENAVWSMRGNFVDVPTDCPQRDERLGWTGDLQVFAPSAAFLYDCAGFLDSWLADLAADQYPDGGVPFVVPMPSTEPFGSGTAAAWADAAVIVPWVCYRRFADEGVLARQYPSMTAFVEACLTAHGPSLNAELFQFGDWLDPAAPADKPSAGPTEPLLVAGAYLVHSLDIVAATGRVLGRSDDAARYESLATRYRQRWRELFRDADGRLSSDTLTAYALAVCFDLLETGDELADAGRRMATLCEHSGYRIATGFVGTPLVCDALTSTGQLGAAYRLLLQTECPSWLYPVTRGATTIWERWDSLKPDGQVNADQMTSFNHYALGAVVDWLHRAVAGLTPLDPGYRTSRFRPLPGGGLTWAKARHLSPYGEVAVEWRVDHAQFECTLVVPPGTTAVAELPIEGWTPQHLSGGRHRFNGPLGVVDGRERPAGAVARQVM